MGLSEKILSPSDKQIKLWHIISGYYQLNFRDKEDWLEYLYDLGIDCQINIIDEDGYSVIPNPSEEGFLKINEELSDWIISNGMPWKIT